MITLTGPITSRRYCNAAGCQYMATKRTPELDIPGGSGSLATCDFHEKEILYSAERMEEKNKLEADE